MATKKQTSIGPATPQRSVRRGGVRGPASRMDGDALRRAVDRPTHARPASILALQRLAGNQAVSGLIQAKLTVGGANDHYEQEADRVAEQVMSAQPHAATGRSEVPAAQRQGAEEEEVQTKPLSITITPVAQRQAEEEEIQTKALAQRQEDEEEIQTKALAQRQEDEEEIQTKALAQRQEDEEEIQTKPLAQRQEDEEEVQTKAQRPGNPDGSFEASASLESRLSGRKGAGMPLPDEVRTGMEPHFGTDFSRVRIHTDGEAVQMNRELQSQAFTHGQDIYFKPDLYNPASQAGKRLIAHELTHVVQQTGRSDRIARWGGPGNTTSHDQVTEKAFETLNPKIRMWYSDQAQAYLANMSEQMDMRAGFLVLCGKGKLKQWWKKFRGKGMYRGEPTVKQWLKMSKGQYSEAMLRAGKEYDDMVGYWRSASEAPNHAEAGMYKEDGKDMNLARADQYVEKALGAWKTNNPRQALAELALALHLVEDRGAHGDGKPGTGHDPRRLIPPPRTAKMGWVFEQSNPGWKPGQAPSWKGTDCDLKDKNPAGYHLAVMEAKRVLTEFAVGIGLGDEEITEQMMKKGAGLAGFKQPGKFKRGLRKVGQFFGKGAIRP